MNLPTDNANIGMLNGLMGSQNLPMLQFYMDNYGMVPPQVQNSGILNQRSAAALTRQLPPAPNRQIGMGEAAIRIGGAGLGGAQKGGLQAYSDMAKMYGGIQDYNRSRSLEDYNAKVNAMYREAMANKAMNAGKPKGSQAGINAVKQASSDVVFDTVTRALDMVNTDLADDSFFNNWLSGSTGIASAVGQFLPTHPANKLNSLITTIKGNIGFDKLQSMREASPTGGALGQVSNMELGQLNATLGALEQSIGPEELKYNLQLALHQYMNIIHGAGNHNIPPPQRPNMQSTPNQNTSQMSQDDEDLISKYTSTN